MRPIVALCASENANGSFSVHKNVMLPMVEANSMRGHVRSPIKLIKLLRVNIVYVKGFLGTDVPVK